MYIKNNVSKYALKTDDKYNQFASKSSKKRLHGDFDNYVVGIISNNK